MIHTTGIHRQSMHVAQWGYQCISDLRIYSNSVMNLSIYVIVRYVHGTTWNKVSRIYVTVIVYIVLMYMCVSGHVTISVNCDRWTWNNCVWCIGDIWLNLTSKKVKSTLYIVSSTDIVIRTSKIRGLQRGIAWLAQLKRWLVKAYQICW